MQCYVQKNEKQQNDNKNKINDKKKCKITICTVILLQIFAKMKKNSPKKKNKNDFIPFEKHIGFQRQKNDKKND